MTKAKGKSLKEWVKRHRALIDKTSNAHVFDRRPNDADRALYVMNDYNLYKLAQAAGVTYEPL